MCQIFDFLSKKSGIDGWALMKIRAKKVAIILQIFNQIT